MGIAISALLATLAVIYGLSVTSTNSAPVSTLLNILIGTFNGRGRILTADEAMTALFYAVVIYLVVFSISFFLLRFLGMFLLALGMPDDQQLRDTQLMRRNVQLTERSQRRNAKLIAQYIVRALRVTPPPSPLD